MRIEIPDDCLSELTKATLLKTIERAKHAHYTNVVLRINGQDVTVEADWIKYMKIDPVPPIFVRFHRRPFILWSWQKTGWVSFVLCGLEVSFPRWRVN